MTRVAVIAVDGPAGSGKSTVSRRLATRLGWAHLDTGAFYRAATLAVLEAGADPDDADAVSNALDGRRFSQLDGAMYLDDRDVSDAIRGEAVTAAVSRVSAYPWVREQMVAHQRRWVDDREGQAVVEGRDIGTVVFPEAELKIHLTADPMTRAQRRALETGDDPDQVVGEIENRDRFDSSRATSPLRVADDAIVIDTTDLSVEEVVDRVVELYEKLPGS